MTLHTAIEWTDAAVREDGKCAVCSKPRKLPASNKYGGEAAYVDPFCSSTCCRAFHGTETRTIKGEWARDYAGESA